MASHAPAFDLGPISVRIEWSGLALSVLIGVLLLMRAMADNTSTAVAVLVGVTGAVAFTISILAHELGHAFEAQHRGMPVEGVRLMLLGGVTNLGGEAKTPRDEFFIAAVGPWVNLFIAAIMGTIVTAIDNLALTGYETFARLVGVLGWLNVSVALFNLVPGSPLDGGRMLRAGIWAITGDRERAVRGAALAGMFFALVLSFGSLRFVLGADPAPPFWRLVIDLGAALLVSSFLLVAAAGEHRRSRGWTKLSKRPITSLDAHPIRQFDQDVLATTMDADHPATMDDDTLIVALDAASTRVGALRLETIRAAAAAAAPEPAEAPNAPQGAGSPGAEAIDVPRPATLAEIATPIAAVTELAPEASITELVEALREHRLVRTGFELWTLRRVQDALDHPASKGPLPDPALDAGATRLGAWRRGRTSS